MKANVNFELSTEDMELIEAALRKKIAAPVEQMDDQAHRDLAHRVNELLGKLHNQKNFFRPTSGTYVGG